MSRIRSSTETDSIKCCVKGCKKRIIGLSNLYQHIQTFHPQFVVDHNDFKEIQKKDYKERKEIEILRKRRKVSEEEVPFETIELINLKMDRRIIFYKRY